MVLFLYRPEYYGITEDEEGNPTQGLTEVIVAKHRNGSLDSVMLKFVGKYTKFADMGGYDAAGPGHNDFGTITKTSRINNSLISTA